MITMEIKTILSIISDLINKIQATTAIIDAIADISVHALIRHQYQRAMYTIPIPALIADSNNQAKNISFIRKEIAPPRAAIVITIATESLT